jgi:hypothetical protein
MGLRLTAEVVKNEPETEIEQEDSATRLTEKNWKRLAMRFKNGLQN